MKDNYFILYGIILHGSFGSPFANWLPWLRRELRKRGKEVSIDIVIEGTV